MRSKMKKKEHSANGKIISLLLAAAMLFSLQGISVSARMAGETAYAVKAAERSAEKIRQMPKKPVHICTKKSDRSDKTEWSYVYFGSYPQTEVRDDALTEEITGASYDANGDAWVNGTKYRRISESDTYRNDYFYGYAYEYRYFKWERIKWRVLDVNENTMFVMADKCLNSRCYHEESENITWENCVLRSWLNHDFYDTAFSGTEQRAIVEQTILNEDNPEYNTEGGNNTKDKVFLLSLSEITNPGYGFCGDSSIKSVSRWSETSDFAHVMGVSNNYSGIANNRHTCSWYLRSPGSEMQAARVLSNGDVSTSGASVYLKYSSQGCVPALHISLSSSLWSMTDDGTSGEGGGGTGGGETPPEDSNIQCAASCSVEAGDTAYIITYAYGENREDLKKTAESVTWKSADSSVVKVGRHTGYSMPLAPDMHETEEGSYEVWRSIGALSVVGVSEGTATVTGTAADGSVAVCKVTVSANESGNAGGAGSGGSLTLGAEAKGSSGGDSGKFFPSSWALKSAVFPIEIKKKEEADGSFRIRGAIGVGRSDWLDKDSEWSRFKSNVKSAQKYSGEFFGNYQKLWGAKSLTAVSTEKFKVLPKLSVMGYFENFYDKNGNLISRTGKLAADAKWSAGTSWQFATPIGPVYLNLEGSGKLSGEIGPEYDYQTQKVNIANGSLTVTPEIAVEGGYGIDKVAAIGAKGALSLPITLIPATKGEFEADAFVHVTLVFVIDWEDELASYKTTLWDTTKKKALKGAVWDETPVPKGTLSAMDTSFTAYEGAWNGAGGQPKSARKRNASGNGEQMLQDGLLPSSLPMLAEAGGKQVLVFQAYDANKDTLNSSILKYSVLENGAWSAPQAVWDEGGSDLFADLKTVDGKLVLAWQKLRTAVTGDIEDDASGTMREIAEKSEICFAEFDPAENTFVHQAYVTDNEECDMMPQIFENGNGAGLAWVKNGSASLMQAEGTNEIYISSWDGSSFGEETLFVRSPGTVENFAAYQDGEEVKVVYAGQIGEEEKVTAVLDEQNQTPEVFSDLIRASEDGAISGMHYADGNIDFLSNGMLYRYHTKDGTMDVLTAGKSAFGSTAQYCTNGDKGGYVWSVYEEETQTGRIVASMESDGTYSEPVTLYEKQGVMLRHLSPILKENGNWAFAANTMKTADGETNHHALCYIEKDSDSRIALAGVSVREEDVANGRTGMDYFVTNTGDTTVDRLMVDITSPDGTTVTNEIPVRILPGESVAKTAYVNLPDANLAQDVSVSVYAKNQTDIENCTVTDKIGLSDIAVSGTGKEEGDHVAVTAVLSNNSAVNADTALRLYSDEKQTKELCFVQTGILAAGESRQIAITVNKNDIVYNQNDAAYLTLKAEAKGGDYKEDDNLCFVVFYKPETKGGQPQLQTGTCKNPVKVTPKPTSIKGKIKAKKKAFFVKWKKQKSVHGYQVQYSTNKKFTKKKTKIKKVTGASKTKLTVKKLKAGKKYYVRVRTVRKVDGRPYYSKWSKTKTVKTKK